MSIKYLYGKTKEREKTRGKSEAHLSFRVSCGEMLY